LTGWPTEPILDREIGRDAMDFLATTEAAIAAWHGITPPNDAARRLAADLAAVIAAFEAVRGALAFEDEPSSFETALAECKQ
jgi:hypothetical protein